MALIAWVATMFLAHGLFIAELLAVTLGVALVGAGFGIAISRTYQEPDREQRPAVGWTQQELKDLGDGGPWRPRRD